MKALILAAGLGTRLSPLTDEHPKCMTLIHGKSIIHNQIESLRKNGISDITIVGGYKYDILQEYIMESFSGINFINSIEYKTTNNMYSAWMAKEYLYGESFVMMNADVFFDSEVITDLLNFKHENAIITDIGNYLEESMKVIQKDDFLIKISKQILPEDALGNSIDVYKFSADAGRMFFDKCHEYIIDKREVKLWSEVALNDILTMAGFKACPLRGRWYEIDTLEDLKMAENVFAH